MAIQCPVCEMVQDDSALECAQCGRVLLSFSEGGVDVAPIEGLELSSYSADTARALADESVQGLEQTRHDPVRLIGIEQIQVEQTALPQDVSGPLSFEPGPLEIEATRELDDGVRTPAPRESGTCPFCGVPSTGKLCDNCGRRRSRYLTPVATAAVGAPRTAAERAQDEEENICPNCFAHIAWTERCSECGLPLPVRELL